MDRETVKPRTFLYPFQVFFGVVLGIAGTVLYGRYQAGRLGPTGAFTLIGLALAALVFVVYLQNLHKRPLNPDYSRRCYNCRLPVNRYSEFCEHCGADQVERARIGACPACDIEVYEGVSYCPSCGEDLTRKRLKRI